MIHKGFSRIAAVAVAAAFAVGVVGCSAPSPSSSSTGNEHATLRILLSPVFYESVYIAQEKGYFRDANLTVKIAEGGAASEQLPQLLNGQYDVAMTSSVSVVQAVSKGLPISIIANQLATPPGDTSSGILVKKDSPIKDFGDLTGHTLALQGLQDNAHLATLMAIGNDGGDPSKVKIVQLPLPSIDDAITSGQVDAGYPLSIFYGAGLQAGLRSLGSPTAHATPEGPNVVYAATNQYIAQHPDVLKRFDAAIAKATAAGVKNDQLVRDVQAKHSTLPPDYIKTAVIQKADNDISRAGMETVLKGMVKYKFIDKSVPFDKVISKIATVVK